MKGGVWRDAGSGMGELGLLGEGERELGEEGEEGEGEEHPEIIAPKISASQRA